MNVQHSFHAMPDGHLHCVTAGEGQPLVLLHGWPQTWYAWRKLTPALGNDWGGPVAFAHAAFHPGRVTRLAMLDTAVPGDGNGTFSQNGRRWHHAFHQTLDLPEKLIAGRECMYCRWFYEYDGQVSGAITDEDVNENMLTYGRTDHTCKALLEFLA